MNSIVQGEAVTLLAADGYRIAATRFAAQGPRKGHLLMAGATGVPQGFYRRFAEYASAQGFTVMTLDYRGIGQSAPATLKGFEMAYLDWAHLDLAAAVEAMASDEVPLFMVGHSFGGHAFGLLPNHHRVARFYTFATGAGWHGWMPPLERWRVRLMWSLLLPLLARRHGYMPWSKLGMGEDLPLGVYRQWRHWCRFPHYFFDDPAMAHVAERFAAVRTPIIAANALDDLWALPRSRDAFVQAYCNAPLQRRDIDPRDGLGAIGHMGYFRQRAQPLWDDVLDWFRQHEVPAPG
ncbi:alpha/beta fold hydrolase [Pseudomonas sp. LS44]|uniref:alpha/beta hydrolase family protein n=1 Tax=Pseudomonas sp. LS44 TaxID=1357074 RepID=UPI00215A3F07|nr:alpha/beta fold hydrolase [Pseudomonas sp. LS44]UVE16707.1 alpha/beta fold hydrolase [Pseudomonas sp. LS44]